MSIKKLLLTSAVFLGLCPKTAVSAIAADARDPKIKKQAKAELEARLSPVGAAQAHNKKKKWKHGGRP